MRRCEIVGVYGIRYQPERPVPTPAEDVIVRFGDPAIRWTKAVILVRELRDCAIVD